MGWRSTVVTRAGRKYDRFDPGLMDEVPKETEVVRVGDRDLWQAVQAKRAERFEQKVAGGMSRSELAAVHQRPGRALIRGLVRRVEAWAYYPDPARRWIAPATSATVKVCREKKPDSLLVTGGPWSSFLVAYQAYRSTGVPYVLDFRDSWTLTCNEDFEILRPGWARRKDRRLLSVLLRDAQAVIFRYEAEAQCYWQAYPGMLTGARIHIIPNGYEGAVDKFEVARGERCTVLYTGTVMPYRYNELIEALAFLQQCFPDEARCLRVVFVGEGADGVGQAAASRGLAHIVESRGPVSSREVGRLQGDAHALLVLGVRPYQGYELCGSKVFGYLKAGRPILGVLPSDESRRVLERVGVTTVADIDSREEIVAVVRQVLAAWSAKRLFTLLPDPDRCAKYEASNQTQALVRALEGRPAVTPFHPGSVEMPNSLKEKIGCDGWLSPA
jgi:hypothetical protein